MAKLTEPQLDPASVVLDGALGIRMIETVRAALLAALAEHSTVTVDCAAAESVDLSLIQLLLAARRSAQQAGKQLLLSSPAGGVLHAALRQGGFLGASGGDPFWSGDA